MPATSTAPFGIDVIAVVGNGGFWTIQLPSSTTAAFELVQMSSFTTPAIELIQKPTFPTAAFGSVLLGLFSPFLIPIALSSLPVASFSIFRLILPCSLPLRPVPRRRPIPAYSLHLLAVLSQFQVTPLAQCSPDACRMFLT